VITHPTAKELRLKVLDVNRALINIQAMYDVAELGPLNFKIKADAQWILRKQRPASFMDAKNIPAIDYPSKNYCSECGMLDNHKMSCDSKGKASEPETTD
jgi:hypothetical protein